jgi:hypothetical protein
VPIATIVTVVSTAVTAAAALIGALLALRSQPRTQCRPDEPAGTITKKARRQKAVGTGSPAHKKKAEPAEIDEAERLISEGHYRAAVLILNIPLECSLREATHRAGIRLAHSARPGVQMASALFRAEVLDKSDVSAARLFSEIYERAATVSAEPPAGEARLAAELLKRILHSLVV